MTDLNAGNRDLAEKIIDIASEKNLTIGTVESCTGGMIGQYLTTIPGSSRTYLGGIISYANSVKSGLVGVETKTLLEFGAVSEQTARAMARNGKDILGSDLTISVTGIAGPGGGTPVKPVGLVYIGFCKPDGETIVQKFEYGEAGRDRIREFSAREALRILSFYLA